jgi:hypothetical protein
MTTYLDKFKGKIDEFLSIILEILTDMNENGFNINLDKIDLDRPYLEFLRDGFELCLDGRVLPKSFWESEILRLQLLNYKDNELAILELNILKSIFCYFQGYEKYEEFYLAVNLFSSDDLQFKYCKLVEELRVKNEE